MLDLQDFGMYIVGFRNGIPSNLGAIHLTGKIQSEIANFPFSSGVAPNWIAWSSGIGDLKYRMGKRVSVDAIREAGLEIGSPRINPLYQVIESASPETVGGVSRRFLGLSRGGLYHISAFMNTMEANENRGDWSYTLHAAPDNPDGTGLTDMQLAGTAALPDGRSGLTAARMAFFGSGEPQTSDEWLKLPAIGSGTDNENGDIILPPGVTSLTVWVRYQGPAGSKVGLDLVSLETIATSEK